MPDTVYVIGSGPAGIACAHALASAGTSAIVLDAGVDLEPERQHALESVFVQDPAQWDPRVIQMFKEGAAASAAGIPVKRVYGSTFPYQEAREHTLGESLGVATFASYAKGGLSNVWGASVLPYLASDIRAWPISARQLAPYYARVFTFLDLAAQSDELEGLFPLYTPAPMPLRPSGQAKFILDTMNRNRPQLHAQGFAFGSSRLAVNAQSQDDKPGCVYCGLCMYGCPKDIIYKSSHTLNSLTRSGLITYVPNVVVDTVREDDHGVTLLAHHRVTGARGEFNGSRAFVACGVLPTALLMLRSIGMEGHTVTMRDSQYFLLPILARRKPGHPAREALHTLAQVFLEIINSDICDHPVHLQIYTYNDLYSIAIRRMFGPLHPFVNLPARIILDRLMVIQGYLHSDYSSTAAVTLGSDRLDVEAHINPIAEQTVRKVLRILRKNSSRLGFTPLAPMLNLGRPGQGAHVGGTFPMSAHPAQFETDVLGRPAGYQRIHIVDGSVLPSIPSTTITLSVMANAYRIGTEWTRYV